MPTAKFNKFGLGGGAGGNGLSSPVAGLSTGGGVSPATLVPGLSMWHDASQAATVTLNGADVSQVNDLSGSARHASQATSGQQPLYATGGSGINGKSVIAFTGANNDVLNIASALDLARNKPGVTYAGVFRLPAPGVLERVLTVIAGSGVTLLGFGFGSGVLLTGSRRIGADTASNLGGGGIPAITAGVASFVSWSVDFTTASIVMSIDGASQTQIAAWTPGAASEGVAHGGMPTLGRNGVNLLTGDVAESCFWPFVLSPAQIESIRTSYFKPKWGTA